MAEQSRLNPTLRAISDAVLAVAAELSVEDVLQRLVHSARDLAGARYAALGLPDGEGGFRRFLTSGMSDDLADRVRRLEEIEAIRVLKARYADVCDTGYDPERIRPLFTPDAA